MSARTSGEGRIRLAFFYEPWPSLSTVFFVHACVETRVPRAEARPGVPLGDVVVEDVLVTQDDEEAVGVAGRFLVVDRVPSDDSAEKPK